MKNKYADFYISRVIATLSLIGFSQGIAAGNLSISNTPLGTGSGLSVKPNLYFILDDSGSMNSDYMPDYVNDENVCPDSNNGGGDGEESKYNNDPCAVGDPPYSASGFNTIYYNPTIRYWPPMNANGSNWNNASTSTPRKNPFFSSDTSTQDLTKYPNTVWCKNSGDAPTSANPTASGNCVSYPNGTSITNYPAYPNNTYKYRKTYQGKPVYYVMTGTPQWCTSSDLISCQSLWDSMHTWPQFAAVAGVTGVAASRSFYIIDVGASGSPSVKITYDGGTSLATLSAYSANNVNNRNAFADDIVAAIGGGWVASIVKYDTGSASKPCSSSNYTRCPQVLVTAPGGAASSTNTSYNGKSLDISKPSGIDFRNSTGNLSGGVNYSPSAAGVTFTRYTVASGQVYTKYTNRTDCAGANCTYAEELQNFANWYSFYRTRILMMKTSVSRAFSGVSDTAPGAGFRVGFDVISHNSDNMTVAIGNFDATKKAEFYTALFAADPGGYTPLRGALAKAGRTFAGVIGSDPVQFSCQQNFAFLTTDGYWNTDDEKGSYGPYQEDGKTEVGNPDGTSVAGISSPYEDSSNISNTLADVAMYYYKKDLRPSMDNDVPTSAKDGANYQHMVTFTMGLGVDGTLRYSPYYESGGSADYNSLLQGTKQWPSPASSGPERIDDLWHAAVNGRGIYFSAANADSVANSLTSALLGVSAMTGSAAAAATSNLEPVPDDNFAYVASYVTQVWEGNLEAKSVDLVTGILSATSLWSASTLLDTKAAETAIPSGASGPGSRKLYSFDSTLNKTDKKFLLNWTNANALGWSGYFDPSLLAQCSPISLCPGATAQNLFEYLMGGADTTADHSYRARTHVLGDIVNSQPVYVKKPSFNYSDTGYLDTFKNSGAASTRKAMVYVSANDGFLHAFDASTGNEDWAYMPTTVLPNLYDLAKTNYTHRYFADGVITVGDVKTGGNWKTILVAGLGAGGKGFYALDVTDPTAPLALWEFTDARLGLSYGNPVITKLPAGATSSSGTNIAGKWVVLLTSGYNNGTSFSGTPAHNGQGILYVLDAYTGAEYFRIYTCTNQNNDATCAGSTSSPSGLGKINNWVTDPSVDNTTSYVYGGDLEGNLWRFNLAEKSAFNIAEIDEPITVKPELAEANGNRAVFFGTGLFLQATDKNDTTKRSIYGIKDDPAATVPLQNVKTSGRLVEQVMTANGDNRTITSNTVDWSTHSGWFIELLELGERVNVDPKLQLGTLVVASNVPDSGSPTACTTGGHSFLTYLNFLNGSNVSNSQSNPSNYAGMKLANALVVGINIVKLPNGKLMTIGTTADNQHPVKEAPVGTAGMPTRRVSWRELLTD